MAELSGPISRTCPHCGVALPMGYVKCPRCQAELSSPVQVPRGTARSRTDGGGTVVGSGGNRTALVIAAAAALGALGIWLVVRDPSPSTAATVTTDAGGAAAADDEVAADEEPEADVAPDRPAPSPSPDETAPNPSASAALSQLSRDLRVEKIWATVGQDGDVIVIDSSFCEDAGLGGILDAHAGDLRAAKFGGVRCRAPHGGVVFERGL